MEDLIGNDTLLNQENYTIKAGVVKTSEVVLLHPLKEARKETHAGLYTTIKEMGVLTPIVVTPTVGYSEWLEEHGSDDEDDYDAPKYKVLDGFRRIYACMKLGIEELPCRIIEFEDLDVGVEHSLAIGLVLNRYQRHSLKENWSLIQSLELAGYSDPATLDWLLGLDMGDTLRLKDVMTSGYSEVVEQMLEGKKTLQQAYNAIQKLRKEENQSELDDARGLEEVAEEVVDNHSDEGRQLDDKEVKELLEMANDSLDSEDLDEGNNFGGDTKVDDMFGEDAEEYVQDTKNRERLSPELRSAILRRDNFTCQVCKFGEGISSSIQLGLLECHHITAVYTGGTDSSENFVTVCSRCHSFVHILAGFNCKIGMSKEEFANIPLKDQEMIQNAVKYARVLLKAEEKSGKKLKKYKPVKVPFWTAQAEAQQVLSSLAKGNKDEK